GRADDQVGRATRHAPSQDVVEAADAGGDAVRGRPVPGGDLRADQPRVDAYPLRGDPEPVLSLDVAAAAQLEHAQEALVAGRQVLAHELHDAVGDRELGQVV